MRLRTATEHPPAEPPSISGLCSPPGQGSGRRQRPLEALELVGARALALATLVLIAIAGLTPARASDELDGILEIRFEDNAVVASGVTPGGKVAWFSVARETHLYPVRVVRREAILEDESRMGEVTFELDGPVPLLSVWFCVDLDTGTFAVATPEDFELREIALPQGALRPGAGGADALSDSREFLELFLVRPESGAWGGTVGDGGASDASGVSNGKVLLSLSSLKPVAGSPALIPAVFKPGDIVVGIDPRSMEVYAARLVPGGAL